MERRKLLDGSCCEKKVFHIEVSVDNTMNNKATSQTQFMAALYNFIIPLQSRQNLQSGALQLLLPRI